MAEYLITSAIDPFEKGQRFQPGERLPRHVTIQTWFSIQQDQAFKNALQNYATTLSPIEVTGDEVAMFGPEHNVRVRLVKDMGRLASLNARSGELVRQYGGQILRSEWSGVGYRPHVTFTEGGALEKGEKATLSTLELVEYENPAFHVISVLGMSKRP